MSYRLKRNYYRIKEDWQLRPGQIMVSHAVYGDWGLMSKHYHTDPDGTEWVEYCFNGTFKDIKDLCRDWLLSVDPRTADTDYLERLGEPMTHVEVDTFNAEIEEIYGEFA